MHPITFQNISLDIVESPEHMFLMSTRDVAAGYGVNEKTIRDHKRVQNQELIEGKHFIIDRSYKNTPKTYWTKRGIVRLGFFIKSEKAKAFRDWAEDYVIDGQNADNDLKQIIMRQNEQIAQLTLELNSKPKRITEKPHISQNASDCLLDLIGQIARSIDESERVEAIEQKRRDKTKRFLSAFVRAANHSGISEQAMRKSEEF